LGVRGALRQHVWVRPGTSTINPTPDGSPRISLTPDGYRRITFGALLSLCGIIVTGAAVRLTGSGLGCRDWPACDHDRLVAPLQLHPMIEQVNRYLTGIVSIAVILAVLGSMVRVPRRADLTRWSWLLVAGVVAQIILGAVVTLSDLAYSVVAVHFLVSMALVWAATVLHHRAARPDDEQGGRRRWPMPTRLLVAASMLVLLTGPVVTSASPHAGDRHVKRLPVELAWAARVHSGTVWLFLGVLVWFALGVRRDGDAAAMRRVTDLLTAAIVQGAIGYIQYFTRVPPLLVGLHVAGATLVWVLVLRVALNSSVAAPEDRLVTAPAGAAT
jgi:cytochrome c oxidase assembly protein subunit 15